MAHQDQWIMMELQEIRGRLVTIHADNLETRNELRQVSIKMDHIIEVAGRQRHATPHQTQPLQPQPATQQTTTNGGVTVKFSSIKDMIITGILIVVLIGLLLGNYTLEDLKGLRVF